VKSIRLSNGLFGFAYSAFGFARGAGKSTGKQNSAMSARLMETDAGTIALIAGGVIIVAVGGYHATREPAELSRRPQGNSSDLGATTGHGGLHRKGLVIAGAGVLVVVAAGRSEPNKATGLDGALKHSGPNASEQHSLSPPAWNHYLRPVQLRHGPIHQNVSAPG